MVRGSGGVGAVVRRRRLGCAVGAVLATALMAGFTPLSLSGTAVAQTPANAPRVPPASAGSQAADDEQAPVAASEDEALAEAKRLGRDVEVGSLRGESSDVFASPDGTLQAREYLRPVRARVGGEWQPIDTDLTTSSNGTVAPKATAVGLRFSGGGTAPLVRMSRAGREVSLSWPGELPVPELDGATATYRDVLPDVDLRMGAQEDGFTQLLVVKSAQAAASSALSELRLKLAADGVDVKETAQHGIAAVDGGAGSAVFEAPQPMMWDSSTPSGEAAAAGPQEEAAVPAADGDERAPTESGKLAPVGVDVASDGGELVLIPDEDVLKGADTTYPVFIDPQWYSPRASAWTMATRYRPSSPQWKFNGKSDAGMGYCGWAYCEPYDLKRLFYRIPTSKFAGKTILSAEFVVRNTWSASCTAKDVELWRTKDISSSTTWNTQLAGGFWADHLDTKSFAYGYEGCAAKDAEFDVKSAVQKSADAKLSTMTFGLKATDYDEDHDVAYSWKRFSDKAYLRVKYNRPPPQIKMSQLTMEYGGVCKKPSSAAHVRTLGKIYANNVTDPDGDSVSVQFQAKWDAGDGKGVVTHWSPARTTAKKSGSSFSLSLPSSIPANEQINWYVRSYDGAQYSPWSYAGDAPTGCYFVYDTQWPKAPAVSSGEYPASDPEDPEDPWYDGVGKYGSFPIKAVDSDVTTYWYGLNEDPSSRHKITTSGGAEKIAQVLPAQAGLNFFTAQAFDSAGNPSEIRTYQFRVKAGQPERAAWQLDDQPGASQAAASTPDRTAILHGGATPGVAGVTGTAVSFDGVDDYAQTDIPTVPTDTGFSVSAWVKLSALPDHAAVIAAQPGNHSPGFELYYSKDFDRWAFNQYTSDTSGAPIVRAMAPQAGGVSAGEWTHLVGTFSTQNDELRLYVQGQLVGSAAYDSPWDARRGLMIGAGSYDGVAKSFFPGVIDDLRIFDKPLTDTDVAHLHQHEPLTVPGRQARAIFPLDEAADATVLTGHADVDPATLRNGAVVSEGQGVSGGALTLDGTDDYATTTSPQLDNQRSFAVSAWVKLPATKPEHAAIVATQAGAHKSGFELYYSSSYDRWVFNQYSADTTDATPIRAMQPEGSVAYGGGWVHLVGVHDTVADRLTLYVNGAEAGSTSLSTTWYASGPVQIGAGLYDAQPGSYFPGQIDDVRLYDRALSADEVGQLFKQRPLVKGRWMFENLDDTAPSTTPDDSAEAHAMTLYGGAKGGGGFIGNRGMQLDGVDDYATTATMPVDTTKSFTIAAWAQAAATPTEDAALVSADGQQTSAFAVRYVPDPDHPDAPGRWRLTMPDQDTETPVVTQADNGYFEDVRDWNHLAVVYDGFAKQMRLYVNGDLEEVACQDGDGDGTADDPDCTDLVPWAEDALAFEASGGLQVGRAKDAGAFGDYFPGLVDDVWVFQGPLTDTQVAELANSWFDPPTQVPTG
ncbi:LamG-like jellyroll fold domain-containing protein [Streptomyces odontomachi]|uniref:LamG-like jellyroll fold domain-containing protein n=1 Tax=Streptomyces odontomachi TaxID=2944940 RepID=UPI00210F20B8|nr:LamG-like jellyroll fold domain-containing protein [Streptomyces sp. ODS25]